MFFPCAIVFSFPLAFVLFVFWFLHLLLPLNILALTQLDSTNFASKTARAKTKQKYFQKNRNQGDLQHVLVGMVPQQPQRMPKKIEFCFHFSLLVSLSVYLRQQLQLLQSMKKYKNDNKTLTKFTFHQNISCRLYRRITCVAA